MIQKGEISLIPVKLHSITISSVILYTLEVHSTSSSLKKEKKTLKRWKRGEEEKGMERVCAKGKEKGRMRWGRKEERKEKRLKEKEKEKKEEEEKEK